MCEVKLTERIQLCTVVDELTLLASTCQHRQKLCIFQQQATIALQPNVLAVASSVKNDITQYQNTTDEESPDKIYQNIERLWTRFEVIRTSLDADGKVDALEHLGALAAEVESKTHTNLAFSALQFDRWFLPS